MPTADTPLRFVSNPISHYCEKARWALDRAGVAYTEEYHLPLFSRSAAKRAVGTPTVPALAGDGLKLGESNDIVRWVDAQLAEDARWLSCVGEEQAELDAFVERFDRELGPHVRRWCFDQLLPERELVQKIFEGQGPAWERRALRWTYPLASAFLKKSLKVSPESVQRSTAKIDACLDAAEARLAEGRRYLVAERLTGADVGLAVFLAPIVMPSEHPSDYVTYESVPEVYRRRCDELRARPAGAHVLRLYAEHRAERAPRLDA